MIKTFKPFDTWIGREDTEDFLDLNDTAENRVYQMVDVDNPNEKVYTAKEIYWLKKLKRGEIKVRGMSIKNNRLVENDSKPHGKLLTEKIAGYSQNLKRCESDVVRYNSLTVLMPKKTGRYTILKVIETGEYRPMICVLVKDNETGKKYLKYSLTCSTFENETFTNAIVLRGHEGGYLIPKDDVPFVSVELIQDDFDVVDIVNKAFDKLSKPIMNVRNELESILEKGWSAVSLDDYHYFISPEGLVDLKLGCKIYKELKDTFDGLMNLGDDHYGFGGIDYNIIVNSCIIGDMLEELGAKYVDFMDLFNLGNLKFCLNRERATDFETNLSLNGYTVKKICDRYAGMKETDISDIKYTDFCLNPFKFDKREYMKYAYCLVTGANENKRVFIERDTPSVVVLYSKNLDFLCDSWVHQFMLELNKFLNRFGWRIDDVDKKYMYLSNMFDPELYPESKDLISQYFDGVSLIDGEAIKIKIENLRRVLSKYPFNLDEEANNRKRALKWSDIIFNFSNADTSKEVSDMLNTTKQVYPLIENASDNMIIMEFLDSRE